MNRETFLLIHFPREVIDMKHRTVLRWFLAMLIVISLNLGSGCEKPLDLATNTTNSIVTVTSVNDGQSLKSDVLADGYTHDDEIPISLQSQPPDSPFEGLPTELDNNSAFDTIRFSSYHVSHMRTDGGAVPEAFTMGMTFTLPPATEDANGEATVNVIVVRAFDKSRSPLKELQDRGQILTTTTITFYGEDSYGNDVVVSGSLPVSFANFADPSTS